MMVSSPARAAQAGQGALLSALGSVTTGPFERVMATAFHSGESLRTFSSMADEPMPSHMVRETEPSEWAKSGHR